LAAGLALLAGGGFSPARAQDFPVEGTLAGSFTGQFIVTGSPVKSPLLALPVVATNADWVRLDPAVLAVSAERIKQSLYRLLGGVSVRDWQGKIFLVLHPALYADETVTVVARPIDLNWSYQVQLPDVVQRARFLRGLTSVLLLEMANRQKTGDGHSAEIPAWLIDGLSRHLLQDELADVVLSTPNPLPDNPRPGWLAPKAHELDPLANARRVLRQHPALTVEQLSWPAEAQLSGQDDGVYCASAQLFVAELLKVSNGPGRLREMLADLPECYNWQTAFQDVFRDQFHRPLDVEKWWALEVVGFLSRDPGAPWTAAESAGRLDELLRVPVQIRVSSNTLPEHVEIPWQMAISKLARAGQMAVFETRLRDLRIAELRMTPKCHALAEDYCRVLEGYLGERTQPLPRQISKANQGTGALRQPAGKTIKLLNALDARRRALAAAAAGNAPAGQTPASCPPVEGNAP
jgi:hypothetical protein